MGRKVWCVLTLYTAIKLFVFASSVQVCRLGFVGVLVRVSKEVLCVLFMHMI